MVADGDFVVGQHLVPADPLAAQVVPHLAVTGQAQQSLLRFTLEPQPFHEVPEPLLVQRRPNVPEVAEDHARERGRGVLLEVHHNEADQGS